MNYFNHDYFDPDLGRQKKPLSRQQPSSRRSGSDPKEVAGQIAALLGRCLPITDTPELSYLRCFVTLAFEEASLIANRGTPSAEELNYIAYLEREAQSYAPARA